MKKERLGFHLVLLGQITSGKDTQAGFLLKKYNFSPVESGKYWRKLGKEDSKEGEWIRRTTRLGKPAPVVLMKKFLLENIERKNINQDLLFVGNPRLKPEAQLLKKILISKKENFYVLYITLPVKIIYSRSVRSDRYDDSSINLRRRIKWHKEQVSKTVNYFDSLGKLKKINGNQTIEKVRQDIEKALTHFKKLNNKK